MVVYPCNKILLIVLLECFSAFGIFNCMKTIGYLNGIWVFMGQWTIDIVRWISDQPGCWFLYFLFNLKYTIKQGNNKYVGQTDSQIKKQVCKTHKIIHPQGNRLKLCNVFSA